MVNKKSEAKKGKNNPMYGKHHTIKTKRKMSFPQKGRSKSEEHRRKLSEANIGKKHTKESRLKMSEAKKGENNPNYGKQHTEENRQKISNAKKGGVPWNKGIPCAEETRNKISVANTGRVPSKETRDKISIANKGRKHLEAAKIKIGAAHKGEKNGNWKGGKVKVNCKQCGKEKEIYPTQIKKSKNNFCCHKCLGIYIRTQQKQKNTDIEQLIEKELIKRNISFEPQHPLLDITIVDFFIQPNIVIYCDGDYWHSTNKRKEKDERQNFILKLNGYKVFRFTGGEIKESVGKCIDIVTEIL